MKTKEADGQPLWGLPLSLEAEGRERGAPLAVGVVDQARGHVDDMAAALGDHLRDHALRDVDESARQAVIRRSRRVCYSVTASRCKSRPC